jgi:hypothetical protein
MALFLSLKHAPTNFMLKCMQRGLPYPLNFKEGHGLYRKTVNEVSERGFGIRWRKNTYTCIFFVAFIPTLGPTQPPVHWRRGALPPGKKESG